MATNLITTIPSIASFPDLRELKFTTDLDKVVIAVREGGTEIYRTTIYAYEGVASLYDVGSLLELHMRTKTLSFVVFCVECYDEDETSLCEVAIPTVYCSYNMPLDVGRFASSNFLTTLRAKRTFTRSIELLSILHGQGEQAKINVQCVFINEQGKTETKTFLLLEKSWPDLGVECLVLKCDEIVARLVEAGSKCQSLLAYTIICGYRVMTYYVHSYSPDFAFTFKNCFNQDEILYTKAITTQKTSVERSVAVSKKIQTFYDQEIKQEYEVQTAPLTYEESKWAEQLLISHSVKLGVSDNLALLPSILITDSTYEISNSNADLNRIKFTWQYEDTTPYCDIVSTPDDRVHSDPFTIHFN